MLLDDTFQLHCILDRSIRIEDLLNHQLKLTDGDPLHKTHYNNLTALNLQIEQPRRTQPIHFDVMKDLLCEQVLKGIGNSLLQSEQSTNFDRFKSRLKNCQLLFVRKEIRHNTDSNMRKARLATGLIIIDNEAIEQV